MKLISQRSILMSRLLRATLLSGLLLVTLAVPVRAANDAVVFMYHRFGEAGQPATNIRLDQFDAHLTELTSGRYTVLGLETLIDRLESGEDLPDYAVGLSADDAYRSVLTEAWPRLKKRGLPFTLFVATEPVEEGVPGYLTWAEISKLAAEGVTIGNQAHSHPHLPQLDEAAVAAEFKRSQDLFEKHLGFRPRLIAYPYGESSLRVQELAREAGFTAGFGQHSGAFNALYNRFDLPRFAMNEAYGDPDRARLAARARALPVGGVTPADSLVAATNPPAIGFSLDVPVDRAEQLACYTSHAGKARIERLGDTRFEIRVDEAFPKGRTRVNCTLPAGDGRWYWFGRQFYRAPD
ncbi:MAG: polysaccharide deacetylase family protein [Rhodospirillales bacterium]